MNPRKADSQVLAEVLRFARLIWRAGEIREFRAPKHNKYKDTASGYFDTPEAFAAAAVLWDGRANAYITINPVNRALRARANGRIEGAAQNSSSDSDILQRFWILLDVDPKRPSGISSTAEELAAAREVLDAAIAVVEAAGGSRPVTALSGNGYYALYRVDLPNDDDALQLVSSFLRGLAAQCNTAAAHVDTTVSNAARIMGIVGLMKIKGDPLPDQPHRRSELLEVPDQLIPLSSPTLHAVAALAPAAGTNTPKAALKAGASQAQGRLADRLAAAGIEYRERPPDARGFTWYHVHPCPWHEDGEEFECGVGEKLADGTLAGHCFHNRGQGKGWQEWKVALGLRHSRPIPEAATEGRHSGADDRQYDHRHDQRDHLDDQHDDRRHDQHDHPDDQQVKSRDGPDNAAMPGGGAIDDLGVIRALADTICRTEHFARDGGGRLYHYRDGAYRPDGAAVVKRAVKRLLEQWQKSKNWTVERAKGVVEYISVDCPLLWERPPLDTLNVANGLLDIRENRPALRPHSPDFLSTVQIPVRFDPVATCPEWDQFVADTFPEDSQAVPWELVAWLLSGSTSIQKAVLLAGEGSNGKSTFLAAAVAFLGRSNTSSASLHKLEQDRFTVARLVGKLANICPDLPSTHLASTSMFKALTGGDRVQAEYKYCEPFEFEPFVRLLFSANHLPQSDDSSHAFFRRWLVIPFNRTFEGTAARPRGELDAALATPAELSGVLNRALAAMAVIRSGQITESASMTAAWTEFRTTTDPLAVWLDHATIKHPNALVAKDALAKAYANDCRKNGRATTSAIAFGRALKKLRPKLRETQRTVAGTLQWCWLGIAVGSEDGPADGPGSRDSRDSRDSFNCYSFSDQGDGEGERQEAITSSENPVNLVNPECSTDEPAAGTDRCPRCDGPLTGVTCWSCEDRRCADCGAWTGSALRTYCTPCSQRPPSAAHGCADELGDERHEEHRGDA